MSNSVYCSSQNTAITRPLDNPILPGACLGIMGGGQLARMFCFAAHALGYQTMVLDPDPQAPARAVTNHFLLADYEDSSALKQLAQCDAVTTEFENVSVAALQTIAVSTRVSPSPKAISITQNRLAEKQFLNQCKAPIVPYLYIDKKNANEIIQCAQSAQYAAYLPGILKTARWGYDGKGQAEIKDYDSLVNALKLEQTQQYVLEKKIDLAFEFSIILARDDAGHCEIYPPQQNEHQNGILALTIVPAPLVNESILLQAKQLAQLIASQLNYVGVLCVEYFVTKNNQLYVNELAPRPHNSGHYTINACTTSQFEQQVRAMAGLPLGSPKQFILAAMVNILGDVWQPLSFESSALLTNTTDKLAKSDSTLKENNSLSKQLNLPSNSQSTLLKAPAWQEILKLPSAHLHLYGKAQPRKARKMGHITITSNQTSDLEKTITQVKRLLSL